jgi:hypothetical protein
MQHFQECLKCFCWRRKNEKMYLTFVEKRLHKVLLSWKLKKKSDEKVGQRREKEERMATQSPFVSWVWYELEKGGGGGGGLVKEG